jgi:Ser/Thr protein kinase RdoA (MazF antagonist)
VTDDTDRATAVGAAVRAAARYGHRVDDPLVIQETNNVVAWLRPLSIIAKVGRWHHSEAALVREHAVAIVLAETGAPIAPPLPETEPVRDDATGFVVTLWRRLQADEPHDVAAADVGGSLQTLHRHLARYKGDLPSFRGLIDLARGALGVIPALSEGDRATLCRAMDTLSPRIDDFDFEERPLHGEPHLGNLLVTPAGLRWIDFEDVSLGPVEWDLAFLPDDVVSTFDRVDTDLLRLLRALHSACTATWCWARADVEGMLWHARHHLERVETALAE